MNRVIKFRAWDKEEKRMNYERSFEESIASEEYMFDPTWLLHNKEYAPYAERFVLMQFTGLYDAKGKEIYEGDIVEIDVQLTAMSGIDTNRLAVAFSDGAFYPRPHGEVFEVIGNLYENPELLTPNKEV